MSERTTRIQFIMGPSFRAAFNVRNYRKHSELDDIREVWQEERDRKAEEALKERMRGERSMDLHGTNIANAARKGMPARQKRGAEDSHDCYEGHSHYEPFGGELGESMKEIGSAFKNLFNAPPAPPPAKEPIPEREFDPVHPTVEGVDSKLETEKSPTVESKLEPVQPEAQPKVKIYDPSIPVMSPNRCAFSRADLRRSIIMSEVLGKPLALRRGRR